MSGRTILSVMLLCFAPSGALSASTELTKLAKEAEILSLSSQISLAHDTNNVAIIRQLVADDFVGIGDDGVRFTKADEITGIADVSSKSANSKQHDLSVRLFGDTAILSGNVTFTLNEEGTDTAHKVFFTDFFIRRDGRWQLVADHHHSAPK